MKRTFLILFSLLFVASAHAQTPCANLESGVWIPNCTRGTNQCLKISPTDPDKVVAGSCVTPGFVPTVLISGAPTDITPGTSLYMQLGGGDVSLTQKEVHTPIGVGLNTLTDLQCYVSTAPGVTLGVPETITLTVETGTCGGTLTSTALSCTISGFTQTASSSASVSVSTGQCMHIKIDYSANASKGFVRSWLRGNP